jgi:iron complex outermembrane receptor protein
MNRVILLTSAAASVLAWSSCAWAQTAPASGDVALQEITVTAQKREENLQDVPISIAAVTGAQLQARGVSNVNDLAIAIPSLDTENFNGLVLPFLRGVGNASTTAGNESSVATYVDGVFISRLPADFFDLANIDRIEVLKGPQGTLFGRNTTAGVIDIITKTPSLSTPDAFGSFSYGNFNAVAGSAYASTPISPKAAIDFSISGRRDDGFGKNLTTGGGYGYIDSVIGRTKLLYEPTDTTKVTVSAFLSYSNSSIPKHPFPGTASVAEDDPSVVFTSANTPFYDDRSNFNAFDRFVVWGVNGRIDQSLSFANLVSITGYSDTEETVLVGSPTLKPAAGLANLRSPTRQVTQEFQLVNKPDSPIQWILGLYYYNNDAAYTGVPTLIGPAYGPGLILTGEQKAQSYAVFGQATYEILPHLKLTGGLRYTEDQTQADGFFGEATNPPTPLANTPPGHVTVREPTYRAIAEYEFTRDIMGYFSYNHGFKSGNFNLLAYTSDVPTKPEIIDAYEVGEKAEFLDHRLRLNGSAFYYNIKNPQVQLEHEDTVVFSNAGASVVKGAEFDAQALIARGFDAHASVAYLDSRYTDYQNAPASMPDLTTGFAVALPPINAAGHFMPLAPQWTTNLGFNYSIPSDVGPFVLTFDYYYNSGYYFEPDNLLHQGPYSLVNAQLRHDLNDHVSLRLWGKNLNGAEYTVAGSTQVGPLGYQTMPAPPRTFGVALDWKF